MNVEEPPPKLDPTGLPLPVPGGSAEQRPLTPDELKQFDAMLGLGGGPSLIRPAPSADPAQPRLLQTVVVAIILLAVVAGAMYLFR